MPTPMFATETLVRGDLVLRPATLDDAAFVTDVATALHPKRPRDPVVARYWWAVGSTNWSVERFVVEYLGRAIGYAVMERPRWELDPNRRAEVGGDLLPDARSAERLDAILDAMEERAGAAGAAVLRAWADEDDPLRAEAILRRGYHEDRRGRRWELDLAANRERLAAMTEASRARIRAEGIHLLTLAEDPDPQRYERTWRMSEEATQDIPTTLPHIEESLEDYLRWFHSPDIREDRFWIAELDDDIVGCSVLAYPPVRGVVGTSWTATARAVRGRGVARALKCETVMQAIALGVTRVRTGNDAENDPILHINATMGYRPIPGGINFLKSA